jgi:hypothetical protein
MRPLAALASALLLTFLAAAMPPAKGAGETQPCASTFDTTVPFTDYCYHQGVWYAPDTAQFDVLIVPPEGPWAVRDIQLATESVDMWDTGLHAIGGSALSGLNIDAYTLGMEPVPAAALWDPEAIVVLTTETQPFLLLGFAALEPINFCHGITPDMQTWDQVPGFHQHPGSPFGSFVASCSSGGLQCYVVNTSFVSSILPDHNDMQWMYDLISHEVGHCLSLGHVGDADTEDTDDSIAYPHDDIMSYENDQLRATRTHCVSNLDTQVVIKAFSSILAPPGSTAVAPDPAAYVHMTPSDYSQPTCAESDASILDVGYVLGADPLGL